MANASISNYLSLDRYAEIMGLNPLAFNQGVMSDGYGGTRCLGGCGSCDDGWWQHSWQTGGKTSREDLALAIRSAESDIASYLGIPLRMERRTLTARYNAMYPNIYDRPFGGMKVPSYHISDCPVWHRGQLVHGQLCLGTVTIIDNRGDEYTTGMDTCPVLARVVGTVPLVNIQEDYELSLFHAGKSGEPEWRIEPLKSASVSDDGITATITVEVDVWKIIDPDLLEEIPYNADGSPCTSCLINLLDTNNVAAELDIYMDYFDPSSAQAHFGWDPLPTPCSCAGGQCTLCSTEQVSGCVLEGTRGESALIVRPAEWDEDEEAWCEPSGGSCRSADPDYVKIYYWHGYGKPGEENPWFTKDPRMEETIAHLATARLLKPVCGCSCDRGEWWNDLKQDASLSSQETGSRFLTAEILNNPFGMRVGEISAWRRARMIREGLCSGGVTFGLV